MKTLNNKDNNYSLNYSENYKNEINEPTGTITKKYSELLCEYIKFIIENTYSKNKDLVPFIIIRGIDTITNVFNHILYYTKNVDLTYFHCQKSFYFYVEFVGQISEDEKMFLQLTSRDATTYVYKKTIFEISNELKKVHEHISNDTRKKLDIINMYIQLYQTYLLKIIQPENTSNTSNTSNISNTSNTSNISNTSNTSDVMIKTIDIFADLCNKLSNFDEKKHITTLYNVTEKLYYKIHNKYTFFELNKAIINKFLKNPETIKKYYKKIDTIEFDEKILEILEISVTSERSKISETSEISETKNKFISWFIS